MRSFIMSISALIWLCCVCSEVQGFGQIFPIAKEDLSNERQPILSDLVSLRDIVYREVCSSA